MEETPTPFPSRTVSGFVYSEMPLELTEHQAESLPATRFGDEVRSATSRPQGAGRYQLWPRPPKPSLPSLSVEIPAMAYHGRSPTSLSDTALHRETGTHWMRHGITLARRRKISVPDLRGKATMGTVLEHTADSRRLSALSTEDLKLTCSNSNNTWAPAT